MEWGGWDDWKTFRDHYLTAPTARHSARNNGNSRGFDLLRVNAGKENGTTRTGIEQNWR